MANMLLGAGAYAQDYKKKGGGDRASVENGKEGDYIPAIRGLKEALKQAFDQRSTLSETAFKVDQAI